MVRAARGSPDASISRFAVVLTAACTWSVHERASPDPESERMQTTGETICTNVTVDYFLHATVRKGSESPAVANDWR